MHPTTQQSLPDDLKKAWNAVPATYVKKLVERVPRICRAVVKARGGYFEETKVYKQVHLIFLYLCFLKIDSEYNNHILLQSMKR